MFKHFESVQIPENPNAERELLGGLLFDNSRVALVSDILSHDHFNEPVNQRIYKAVYESFLAGEAANPITLKNKFDADGALADIGGAQYLVKLVSSCSTFIDFTSTANEIKRLWQKRQIIDWCHEAMTKAADPECPSIPDEIAVALSSRLSDMESTSRKKKVSTDTEVAQRILEKMRLGTVRYSTGIPKLDSAMRGGLYPGKMYGFAAFSKIGKTNFAVTLSYNLAKSGCKHLFICGEMNDEEIHERAFAREIDDNPDKFTEYDPEFIKKVERSVSAFKGYTLYQKAPGLTFDELKQYMSRAIYRDKVKGVILDYFQLVGGAKQRESEAKHLDGVAQWLADFGRQHGIFTIVTAQRNDDGDIRGSRGLRLACDQLYYLNREDKSMPQAWLEMNATRYTKWCNIGSEDYAGLMLNPNGPYFE